MGLAYLGVVRDFSVFWIDPITGDHVDLDDPTIEIVHYDTYGNEVADVPPTTMTRQAQGHYTHSVYLGYDTFSVGERYFVRFRGYNPVAGKDEFLEETFTAAIDPVSAMLGGGLCVSFIC